MRLVGKFGDRRDRRQSPGCSRLVGMCGKLLEDKKQGEQEASKRRGDVHQAALEAILLVAVYSYDFALEPLSDGVLMADKLWQWLRSLNREFLFLLSLAFLVAAVGLVRSFLDWR